MTVFFNGRSAVPKSGLKAISAPDVCKVPAPPAPPIPTPFINVASSADLTNGTRRVLIGGQPIGVDGAYASKSNGDQPGSLGGLVSNKTGGTAKWLTWSFDVKLEGRGAARFLDPLSMNGNSGNTVGSGYEGLLFYDLQYANIGDFECLACGKKIKDHCIDGFPVLELENPPKNAEGSDGYHTRMKVGHADTIRSGNLATRGIKSNNYPQDTPVLRNVFTGKTLDTQNLNHKLKKHLAANGPQAPKCANGPSACSEQQALHEAMKPGGPLDPSATGRELPKIELTVWFKKHGKVDTNADGYRPAQDYPKSKRSGAVSTDGFERYGGPCATCQVALFSAFCPDSELSPEEKGDRCEELNHRLVASERDINSAISAMSGALADARNRHAANSRGGFHGRFFSKRPRAKEWWRVPDDNFRRACNRQGATLEKMKQLGCICPRGQVYGNDEGKLL